MGSVKKEGEVERKNWEKMSGGRNQKKKKLKGRSVEFGSVKKNEWMWKRKRKERRGEKSLI